MKLRVKEICKSKGLTMAQLAEMLGIGKDTISRNVNGNPTLETLEKIATTLGVPVSDLFDEPKGNVFQCPKCGTTLVVKEENSELKTPTG